MSTHRPVIILIAALMLLAPLSGARADSQECDASVIDVTVARVEKGGDGLADDVYIAPTRQMSVTTESVFSVFRPAEVNEEPVRHYPLALYVGRLKIIDVQDEVLIGRMIEFASGEEHPRVRHAAVMIGDCLRLVDEGGAAPEEAFTVEHEELPAEVLDISALKFQEASAPEPARVIPSKVLFKFDSSVIEDKWNDDLAQLAGYIAREKPSKVVVEGHADWIGTDEYNLKLSERRARAVIDYLVSRHGLDRNIFEIEAYGESRPEASNKTAGGRQKNRRSAMLVYFRAIPTAEATAASPDWPLAVRPEELAPEDSEIPVISPEMPDEEELAEEL